MFCPKCSAQNELNQGYCRQCGQSLSGVRLALDGRPVESLAAMRAGERLIHGGCITLVVFTLIALLVSIISAILTGATYNISIIINLLLGLVIGLPLILIGRAKLRCATYLLSKAQHESGPSLPDRIPGSVAQLNDIKTDFHGFPAQGSVTEDPTLDLKRAERARPKSS